MATKTGGSKAKYGRNKKRCEVYRMLDTRMANKRRKVWRHYKRQPSDTQARNWLHAAREL